MPHLLSWQNNPYTSKKHLDVRPYDENSNAYYIGITGGSVAFLFYQEGLDTLKDKLQQCSYFQDKEIVFVSMAIMGFKQPQQLMALNYYLSMGGQLDLLINIDGFNEVVLGILENVPVNVNPFYPRGWYYLTQGLADRDVLMGAGAMLNTVEQTKRITKLADTSPIQYSFTAALLWKLYVKNAGYKILRLQQNIHQQASDSEDNMALTLDACQVVADNLAEDLHTVWQTCSVQMDVVCRGNDIRYYHFLQPNQYFDVPKPFSESELALDRNPHIELLVTALYPGLISKGRELAAQGIQFHDMTMVFSDVPDTLFIDECCHFNRRGNEILAEAIAGVIVDDYCR